MTSHVFAAVAGFVVALSTMDWIAEFRTVLMSGGIGLLVVGIVAWGLTVRKQRRRQFLQLMSEYADRHAAA
ncbi:hypothetical protein KOR42_11260 [Thalassoglobus neptunius]|uniref:Uncharacterized protein n=2 Tax=Thalassoglobus neptunius TaxID=1938619 RepID=A0A5C5X4E6_9PLAN|nr:hypothetical protein KOR42_11260 [Thalassoglobus neptunius]